VLGTLHLLSAPGAIRVHGRRFSTSSDELTAADEARITALVQQAVS